VYREHALYVKKMIAKLADKYSDVLTPEDMEDIEQDVWFRVMKSLDGFQGRLQAHQLYRRNCQPLRFIDHFKSAKKHQSENYDDVEYELSPPHRMSPEERLDIELMLDSIIDTVHAMTDRRQMVFYLIGIKKYTQSMTAEKLRLTQSTVSEHWASIQQELKQAIKARFPESNCNLEELLWRIDI
jgi:RNA polymerase sigma factor (sigma-70 family)